MTVLEQNQKLLNDILERNYYQFFIKNQKFISLTFFYNLKYTNVKYIKDYSIPKSNIEQIKENFIQFLNWYSNKNFNCDIKIQDEFWLYNNNFFTFIFESFLNNIKNNNILCKKIIIKTKLNSILNILDILQNYISLFKSYNVDLIFSIETDLIDTVEQKNILNNELFQFIKNNNFKLKIIINPNNYAYFEQIIFNILDKYTTNIYLYEEANYGWTDYKFNEYKEFLNKYIDYLKNLYQSSFLNQLFSSNDIYLISLKDKGILDGTGKCSGNCDFYNSLCILLEDFSINLCPKFQFDDQIIGYFIVENNNLIAKPKILELISMNIHLKRHSTPHCENCILLPFCNGCCCKSSYDICLNPIIPVRQFCEMQHWKYSFIISKLIQENILTKENIQSLNISNKYKQFINEFIEQVGVKYEKNIL